MKQTEQERSAMEVGEEEGEAVVACNDQSMKVGAVMWDLETGEKLLHIPSCASPPFGFLCLRNRFVVASQLNRHGSVGDGTIAVWSSNKPQQPVLNYTVEAIGPLTCTNDDIYLAAGALSGNAYLWNVSNGKLLKTWRAHNKSLNCMLFSYDNSFLISSSDDGMICVWSMISLLDIEEMRSSPPPLHCLSEHVSSITGLLTASDCYFSSFISSSLDGTCKVWDFISGSHIQTQVYPLPITSIALHQSESLLFCGTEKGTIFLNKLDVGREEGPFVDTEGQQPLELIGHSGTITALTLSRSCLISGSEDGSICVWNISNLEIIQRFSLQKGKVSNLVVVSRSSLLSTSKNRRVSNEYNISPLDKYPQLSNSFMGICPLYKGNQTFIDSDTQKVDVPTITTMQMKVETSVENRVWAANMAKHVMVINKELKSQLLNLMNNRLFRPNNINLPKTRRKKLKI